MTTLPWVDVDPAAISAPHRRDDLTSFLDRAPTRPLAHGRIRVQCRTVGEAVSVAALLRHLGAPRGAVTLGESE